MIKANYVPNAAARLKLLLKVFSLKKKKKMKKKPCWKNTGRECAIWRWHKSPNWLGLKNFKTIKSRRTHTHTHDYTCAWVCVRRVPVQIICIQYKHNVRLVPSSWGFNQQKCLRIRQQHTHAGTQTKWRRMLQKNFDGTPRASQLDKLPTSVLTCGCL